MAKLYLFREEMDAYRPPAICMRCGAPAETTRSKTFLWMQGGNVEGLATLGTLINLVLLLCGTKRFRLAMPLCPKHTRRRRLLSGLVTGGLIALVLFACLGVFALTHADDQNDLFSLGACSLTGAGLLAVGLIFLAGIMHITGVQVGKITNQHIALFNVSRDFVQGVHSQRTNYPRELRRHIAETMWSEGDAYEEREKWKRAAPGRPASVFVLWRAPGPPGGRGGANVIGVYSSRGLAERARQRLIAHAGAGQAGNGLRIDLCAFDPDPGTGSDAARTPEGEGAPSR